MEWKDKLAEFSLLNGPKLIGAIVMIAAGFVAAYWIGKIVERGLHKKLEPPLRMLIERIVRLVVIGLTMVMALGTLGFNVTALITGLGVAGLGIGLAMQGVLSSLVAGLTIIFTKPFRIGEYIDLLGEEGVVEEIELLSTTLRHSDLSHVVIPNRKIVGEILHNYGNIRQLNLLVGVSYQTDLAAAFSAVHDILRANPRTLKDPAPVVGVSKLADSSINIAVQPWVKVGDFGPAGPELYQAIVERFRASRIEIPFPQHEVRLLNGGPAAEQD